MRGHTFHQHIELNKDINMKRKNFKSSTKAQRTNKPSQRWLRRKAIRAQRDQGAGSSDGVDGMGEVVTRYEIDGIALFNVLPDQLEHIHPDHLEELFDSAEAMNWRVTLQTANACFVLTLYPHELQRALTKHGLTIGLNKTEAEAKATADSDAANPSAPTGDSPTSTT